MKQLCCQLFLPWKLHTWIPPHSPFKKWLLFLLLRRESSRHMHIYFFILMNTCIYLYCSIYILIFLWCTFITTMTPAFEVLATSLRLRLGHECGTFGGAGGWQVTAEDAAPWYGVRESLTCWWGGARGGEDENFPDALQDVCEHDNPCLQVNWAHDFDYMWEVVNVFMHNCVDFAV